MSTGPAYMPDERKERNNTTFREANERIRAKSRQYEDPLEAIPFLCECPREECTTIVLMTAAEYASVRSDERHFFTAVGHEAAEGAIANAIARRDGYVIVEKVDR